MAILEAILDFSKCLRVREGYSAFFHWGHVWGEKNAKKSSYLPHGDVDPQNEDISPDYVAIVIFRAGHELAIRGCLNTVLKQWYYFDYSSGWHIFVKLYTQMSVAVGDNYE